MIHSHCHTWGPPKPRHRWAALGSQCIGFFIRKAYSLLAQATQRESRLDPVHTMICACSIRHAHKQQGCADTPHTLSPPQAHAMHSWASGSSSSSPACKPHCLRLISVLPHSPQPAVPCSLAYQVQSRQPPSAVPWIQDIAGEYISANTQHKLARAVAHTLVHTVSPPPPDNATRAAARMCSEMLHVRPDKVGRMAVGLGAGRGGGQHGA